MHDSTSFIKFKQASNRQSSLDYMFCLLKPKGGQSRTCSSHAWNPGFYGMSDGVVIIRQKTFQMHGWVYMTLKKKKKGCGVPYSLWCYGLYEKLETA